jgi:hypothetical protein
MVCTNNHIKLVVLHLSFRYEWGCSYDQINAPIINLSFFIINKLAMLLPTYSFTLKTHVQILLCANSTYILKTSPIVLHPYLILWKKNYEFWLCNFGNECFWLDLCINVFFSILFWNVNSEDPNKDLTLNNDMILKLVKNNPL